MTMYKIFMKIIKKTLPSLLIFVFVFTVLAGINSVLNKQRDDFSEIHLNIGILNKDESKYSKDFENYIKKGNNVTNYTNEEKLSEDLFLNKIGSAIILNKNDFENFINNEKKINAQFAIADNSYVLFQTKVSKYLTIMKAMVKNGNYSYENMENLLSNTSKIHLIKNQNSSADVSIMQFYKFLGYFLMTVVILGAGMVVADFKKINLRCRVSPYKKFNIDIQILLGQVTLVMLSFIPINILNYILHGKEAFTNFFLYNLNSIIFAVPILSLTYLLNSITSNKSLLSAFSTTIPLGLSFISGLFIPMQFLGKTSIFIAKFFPMIYYIESCESIFKNKLDIYLLLCQLLFGVFYFLIGKYISQQKEKYAL